MAVFLGTVLASEQVLASFHRCHSWQLPKSNGLAMCSASSMACAMSKVFYRYLQEQARRRGSLPAPPLHAFGCVKGRRREDAIAVQMCVASRLRALGRCAAITCHCIADAFHSVLHLGVAITTTEPFGNSGAALIQ